MPKTSLQVRTFRWISDDFAVDGSGLTVRKQDDRRGESSR